MSPNRREFVITSASSLVALTGAPAFVKRQGTHDLVIRGGSVFAGQANPGVEADVAISGDKIAAVGRVPGRGTEEIDARGLAVSPGFIDIHSHGDGSVEDDPRQESLVRQGITTIVVGQDGSSRATGRPQATGPGPQEGQSRSFSELFVSLDALKPAVNIASMIGLGSVRGRVVGNMDRPATPDEIRTMTAMVESALAEGACGASSGLEYTPGGFASTEELIALCRPLAARGLPYATHMRNEDDRLLDSIDESIAVATGARCPLQISHLKTQGPRNWSKLDTVFARIETTARSGTPVTFDRYPYIAYATGLTNLFPIWSRDGGTDAFLARLADATVSPRIKAETLAKVDLIGGWENVHISSVRDSTDRAAEGKRLGAYAKSISADPYELTVAMLNRNRGSVGMVGFAMSEENLDRILAHPRGMVASDGGSFAIEGPTRRGSPHPRGLGTFPRVLGRYVRERKALTLAQAIHKMTLQPATVIKLPNRGALRVGWAADVVVFDPATVADRATYEEPFQYPTGIKAVVINGVVALRDDQRSPRLSGKALRPA
jgi:N-acyl-D-amino-acid deacylase